jgi:hypothetical protein
MDWLLLAHHFGGLICGRRRKQRIFAPRSPDIATLVSHRGRVQPARACQMVCLTLPDLLARGNDLHLAVSAWVGTHRDGSFFSGGNSYDRRYWRCVPVWNWRGTSLAYSGATFHGDRHSDVVCSAPIISVSAKPDPLHCHSIARQDPKPKRDRVNLIYCAPFPRGRELFERLDNLACVLVSVLCLSFRKRHFLFTTHSVQQEARLIPLKHPGRLARTLWQLFGTQCDPRVHARRPQRRHVTGQDGYQHYEASRRKERERVRRTDIHQ